MLVSQQGLTEKSFGTHQERPRQLFSAVQMLERGHYLDGLAQTHFIRKNARSALVVAPQYPI